MFLVWSLDRIAKLYYLILECETANLNECLSLKKVSVFAFLVLNRVRPGIGFKNFRDTPLSKILGSTPLPPGSHVQSKNLLRASDRNETLP